MNVRTINEDLELRNKKRKRNQKAKMRFVFWLKFVLTAGLLVATLVLLALSPLFAVNRVEVKGAVHYSEGSLISISGVVIGENGFRQVGSSLGNAFRLRVGSAEKAIRLGCPYVETVKVGYVLPATIVIDVLERTAAAAVPFMGTSLLIDREGYVLEILSSGSLQKLPAIKGLKFDSYELGKKPAYSDKDAMQTAFRVLDGIKELDRTSSDKLYEAVDSVDVSDLSDVMFSLESRLNVKLGDMKDLNYKLSSAKTIFEKNIKKEDKGILDFTSGENPVFTPESGG